MSKRNKVIYWIATIWLCLGLIASGIVQLLQVEKEIDFILKLGYPDYFLILLGVWKILAVIALLIPKFPLLKEWAYAGCFFFITGAIYSHIAMNSPAKDFFGPLLLLVLTIVSWSLRPDDRKLILTNRKTGMA